MILSDLDDQLERFDDIDAAGPADATAFARQAVAAARDGHLYAAQALAASGIGQILHRGLGYPAFKGLTRARKRFSNHDMDEATIWVVKTWLIHSATAFALTDTRFAVVEGFNRHGTHHGKREFYSEANAIASLLLLVAWVRELQ